MSNSNVFWLNEPKILLNKDYIVDLWPCPKMSFEEKLNSISRLVIFLTILGFIFTLSVKILIIGFITLGCIIGLYKFQKPKFKNTNGSNKIEGFSSNHYGPVQPSNDIKINNPETLEYYLKSDFEQSNKKNPFNNVLLTQIQDDPTRKAAPPSFNPDVDEDIMRNVKKMVQNLNPGIKNTNKQLFGDLGENFDLDQSMRIFNSTPNTKIPNDQGAFAEYLYGNMPSCRDGDAFACVQDNYRYTLY